MDRRTQAVISVGGVQLAQFTTNMPVSN